MRKKMTPTLYTQEVPQKNFVVQSVGNVIKKSTWISNERTHRITFGVQKYNNRYNYRNTNTYII